MIGSDFIRFLKAFPKQPTEAVKQLKNVEPRITISSVRNIVVAGMGGSAIAGELLSGYLREELKVPMTVHRDYGLPTYIDKYTLVIVVSYSGETEETLSALRYCVKTQSPDNCHLFRWRAAKSLRGQQAYPCQNSRWLSAAPGTWLSLFYPTGTI